MDRHKLIFLLLFCGRVFGQSAAPGPTSINSIKNAIYCLDTSVSANTITCSTALGFAGYSAGQTVDLKLANSVTGATTIAINGLASKAVTYNGTTTLVSGIFVAGGTYRLTYDGTRFVIQGSAGGSACGSIAACNTGAWTAGAFGYDFSGATSVGLPAPWVATNVSNTFSLQPQIFTNSGAVAGLRSAGGNTSDVNAGSFGVYGAGQWFWANGTARVFLTNTVTADRTVFIPDSNSDTVPRTATANLMLISGSTAAPTWGTVLPTGLEPAHTGDVTNSAGSLAMTIAANAVTSAKMAVVNTRRVCDIGIGDTSGSAITNAQLGPQKRGCFIPYAATIVEIDVSADAGTPNVIVGRNLAGTQLNLLSGALATASSGGIACSNTGGTTGIDGVTTCTNTLQNTAITAGGYLELVSGTAGGTAKWMTVHVVYTVN